MKNNPMKKFIVITSINPVNKIIKKYASMKDWQLILVGDRKGPKKVEDKRIIFLDIEKQKKLDFEFVKHCPENHYSRKNIGYLYAISHGAEIIAESDDDNLPKNNWGKNIDFKQKKIEIFNSINNYFNSYEKFSKEKVWPRGLPLAKILEKNKFTAKKADCEIGAWQFLADSNPDVDAIYRLTINKEIFFDKRKSFALEKNTYSPFNTQNTFWNDRAFPLLYLPISVTFRFTDILRSYVAQRLFWEKNLLLGFGEATVTQIRNKHDLMKDFADEIPVYTQIENLVRELNKKKFTGDLSIDLFSSYEILKNMGIVSEQELKAVKSWMKDLQKIKKNNNIYGR